MKFSLDSTSHIQTPTCYSVSISPPCSRSVGAEDKVSTDLILRNTAEAERVGVACMLTACKDSLAAASQLNLTASSHCWDVEC